MKIDVIRLFFRLYLKNKSTTNQGSRADMSQVKNVLVISNTAIGDTLFATSAIQLIKKHYPNKRIIALLNPKNYQLFENNPNIDEVITYSGKWRHFLSAVLDLKKHSIDLTFIMNSNEPQATPLSYCIGSKYIVRIPNHNNEFNHLHLNTPATRNYQLHTINTRLRQLEYAGIHEQDYRMYLFPEKHWYESVLKIVKKERYTYIGMQIGASTPSRMWRNSNWTSLANKILSLDSDIRVVLTGSRSEQKDTDIVEQEVASERLLNLAGKFDICGAAALVDLLDLLITPDTGPLHVAGALQTPTIAISVAGTASSANPINPNVPHIFIEKPKICTPCIDKRCQDAICMEQISVNEVYLETKKILSIED